MDTRAERIRDQWRAEGAPREVTLADAYRLSWGRVGDPDDDENTIGLDALATATLGA